MAILGPHPESGPHVSAYHRFWLTCGHLSVCSELKVTFVKPGQSSCAVSLSTACRELGSGGKQVVAAELWSQF